jgi:protein TonB
MAATSLPVARLLQLRVAIAWQEAVALVNAADSASAADAIPITLEHCHITTAGEVYLTADLPGRRSGDLSPLQLLQALLEGQSAPAELRALVATADDALASFPSEHDVDARPRLDLRSFVSANPLAAIAHLAARGLAADGREALVPNTEPVVPDPSVVPLVRTRPRAPLDRVKTRRRPAVTVRVERPSSRVALGLAAILLALASGAAAMGALVGGVGWPLVSLVASDPTPASPPAPTRTRTRRAAPAPEPIASEPMSALSPFTELSAASSPSDLPPADPVESTPPEPWAYSSADDDVEPPVLLRQQMPAEPRTGNREQFASELELVIDEHGLVQRVRLDSAAPSLNDRMIVAAAKAWRFRPATRNGQAVPYVLRVPVTR